MGTGCAGHETESTIVRFDDLEEQVGQLANRFRSGRPFPHIVLDHAVDQQTIAELDRAYPDPDWPGWTSRQGVHQPSKYSSRDITGYPQPLLRLIAELSSGRFVDWLGQIAGIEHLLPDPHLDGGGLQMTRPGGWLTPHTDFHLGNAPGLHRRLNLLLYMNQDWHQDNGGELELWDQRRDEVIHRIVPELGTMVIFQTDARSLHGFSTPVSGRDRRSVALYYYTTAATESYAGDHTTYWRERPDRRARTTDRLALGAERGLLGVARGLSIASRALGGLGARIAGMTAPPQDTFDEGTGAERASSRRQRSTYDPRP